MSGSTSSAENSERFASTPEAPQSETSPDEGTGQLVLRKTNLSPMPFLRQPAWTDTQVEAEDMPYFHFFLDHGAHAFHYAGLFPRAIPAMFARALNSRPLQQSILAISSMAADKELARPKVRALTHKSQALSTLQHDLSSGEITEETALAIFLLLYMDLFGPGSEVAQSHLRGFLVVVQHLNLNMADPTMWKNASPLLLLVWRIAVQLDAVVSGVQRVKPYLPACPIGTNGLHRAWAGSFTNDFNDTNIGVASFGLDDLAHQTHHWMHEYWEAIESLEYAVDPVFREQVETLCSERIELLREGHALWIQQPTVTRALQAEVDAQKYLAGIRYELPRFLDYPPLAIYDQKFVLLLNHWRLLAVLATFFPSPNPLYKPRRSIVEVIHAIQICRAHVALSLGPNDKSFLAEFFSVIAATRPFAGGIRYEKEYAWCRNKLRAFDEMRHGTLTDIQDFVDKVNGQDLYRREDWDLDLYIEPHEFSGDGRFSLASLLAPFEGFEIQVLV
jgi:Fungal specific transcription factor domain